jgi:hypothetical protein
MPVNSDEISNTKTDTRWIVRRAVDLQREMPGAIQPALICHDGERWIYQFQWT